MSKSLKKFCLYVISAILLFATLFTAYMPYVAYDNNSNVIVGNNTIEVNNAISTAKNEGFSVVNSSSIQTSYGFRFDPMEDALVYYSDSECILLFYDIGLNSVFNIVISDNGSVLDGNSSIKYSFHNASSANDMSLVLSYDDNHFKFYSDWFSGVNFNGFNLTTYNYLVICLDSGNGSSLPSSIVNNIVVSVRPFGASSDRYQEGFNDGYAKGETDGYDAGYSEGDTAGYQRGYQEGKTAGYQEGYDLGYSKGLQDGKDLGGYQEGYDAGKKDGITEGYENGKQDGITEGYNNGYAVGKEDGKQEGYDKGYRDAINSIRGYGIFEYATFEIYMQDGNEQFSFTGSCKNEFYFDKKVGGIAITQNFVDKCNSMLTEHNLDSAFIFYYIKPYQKVSNYSYFNAIGDYKLDRSIEFFLDSRTLKYDSTYLSGSPVDLSNYGGSIRGIKSYFSKESLTAGQGLVCSPDFKVAYEDGYTTGKQEGYDKGRNEGYTTGKQEGYNNGYSDGVNNSNEYSFGNFFGAIFDAPLGIFESIFNFEIFGVNIKFFIYSLITLAIGLLLVKMALGGK